MNDLVLKNKNCLITGATGGIGKEIAIDLAKKSCNIFLTSTNSKKLEQLKKQLKNINHKIKIESFSTDLTIKQNIDELINTINEKFQSLDILINSAGIFTIKSINKSTLDDFEKTINLNVKLPFILSKEFAKNMAKKKWGRIVFLGSSSSYIGFENGSVYCTSKHAILGLSRSLNAEFKKKNVRVMCISPSSTQTEMGKISSDQDFSTFLNPKDVAQYITSVLLFDNEMMVDESRLNRIKMK